MKKKQNKMGQSHYFIEDYDLESDKDSFECTPLNATLTFHTDSGVFSKKHLDKASELLICTVAEEEAAFVGSLETFSFADLGTGYGAVLIALSRHFKHAKGLGIEVNRKALDLAHQNVKQNKLASRVELMGGDATEIGLSEEDPNESCWDVVVTNPPIRAGKNVVYGFFTAAERMLKPGGRFYAVISKNQGAKSSAVYLETLFPEVEVVAKKGEFRVIRATKGLAASAGDQE